MSEYNRLENGRYVDYESAKTFEFDHVGNKAVNWEDYSVESHVSEIMYHSSGTC